MMDDIDALRAEIERLRDLCDENGIDPDPRDVYAAAPDFMTLAPCEFTKATVKLWSSTNAFLQKFGDNTKKD